MKNNGLRYNFFVVTDDDDSSHLTIATVRQENAPQESEADAYATAQQNPSDPFCKSTGRIIALARLLSAMEMPEEDRRDIWVKYFNQYPMKFGGKKSDLASMLSHLDLTKAERQLIWGEYLRRYPQAK